MSVLIFLIVYYLLLSASLYPLFEKAGEAGWKGLVPGLNFAVWCRLIGRKPAYALWLLFPIVNLFIYAGMTIDMVRSFDKHDFWHSVVAVVLSPLAFFYLGLNEKEKYDGPVLTKERAFREQLREAREKEDTRQLRKLEAKNPFKKSATREWVEAIIFAVFAAAFIRMFLIEAYVIPTPSMEDSLLVGDFLFVSKAHYGIRTPQTIAMIPLLHNRIPILDGESYLESPQLPYRRLPALESIDHNDPVVFNYPEGDSVYVFPDRTWSIYDYRRGAIPPPYSQYIKSGRKDLITRPLDKMDHYIKRCIGLPGDSLQIRDRQVYLNGQPADNPRFLEFMYAVTFPGASINTRQFSDWGISNADIIQQQGNSIIIILTEAQKQKIQEMDPAIVIQPLDMGRLETNPNKLFPHDSRNFSGWTVDNYGPIYIPEKGATVKISPDNLALYERIINVYEDNDLDVRDGRIFVNGKETDQYTFKWNYYWMMGDNRHNSEDSRVWGFVPEPHVVGKPLFIWFSKDQDKGFLSGIRWSRIFSSADKK